MQPGTVVEFIERQNIISAVVLEQKYHKVRMLTMHNREISHAEKRLAHVSDGHLDLSVGRTHLVERLHSITAKRKQLQNQIDLKELWQVLHTEPAWIDVQTMAEFCFDGGISSDHMSAVMRAVFEDRLYFKFDTYRFFPNSPEKVAQITAQVEEEAKKTRIINEGTHWIRQTIEGKHNYIPSDKEEIVEILKSFHLFGNESPHYKTAKEIISGSGLDPTKGLFRFLVQIRVWDEDENLTLHRLDIPRSFSPGILEASPELLLDIAQKPSDSNRKDLTHLSTLTIDGQSTLDFDDAISIQPCDDGYRLWIHITDVGHFLKRNTPVDKEALSRASSIYLPDMRISMLPAALTENLCSLKEGENHLAITITADLDSSANVIRHEIFPSVIRVDQQLTYYDANQAVSEDSELALIYELAQKLNSQRLNSDALQIDLPDINVWTNGSGEISVVRMNRYSPSRLIVSECMILANWLTARFFRDHGQPAIFRSQLPPRQYLIDNDGGTLYQNWMQRRFLSRVKLGTEAEHHAGLGLDAYLTTTSPLRKYIDLVTQRQLRGLLGMEDLYSEEELAFIIQAIREPMRHITFLQQERRRYWILKYLQHLVGTKQEALVLEKRRQRYVVLLTDYMLESSLPANNSKELEPADIITVKIEQANARSDTLAISAA